MTFDRREEVLRDLVGTNVLPGRSNMRWISSRGSIFEEAKVNERERRSSGCTHAESTQVTCFDLWRFSVPLSDTLGYTVNYLHHSNLRRAPNNRRALELRLLSGLLVT